jgi:hypothetical protein
MVLTFKESLIFFCYNLALRILHFSGLFGISFATTEQFTQISKHLRATNSLFKPQFCHKFKSFDYKNSPQKIHSIVVCLGLEQTHKTHPKQVIQFSSSKAQFDRIFVLRFKE